MRNATCAASRWNSTSRKATGISSATAPGSHHSSIWNNQKITEHDRRRNMDAKTDESAGKCPFTGGTRGHMNRDWWPKQLDLQVLHRNSTLSDPMGEAFDYAMEFKMLDLNAVIKDLHALMTDSQEW